MFPAIDTRVPRAPLRRFPYSVYFTVEAKEVAILAVLINTDIPAPGRRGRDRTTKSLCGVYLRARRTHHRVKQVLEHFGWVLAATGVNRGCLDCRASRRHQPVKALPL